MVLRGNFKSDLGSGWVLAWRGDFQITYANQVTASDPDGIYQSGIGRPLVLAYIANVIDDRQAWAIGDDINGPAISGSQFGSGDWDMLPIAAYRYMLPELKKRGQLFRAAAALLLHVRQGFLGDRDQQSAILAAAEDRAAGQMVCHPLSLDGFPLQFRRQGERPDRAFLRALGCEIGRNLGHNLVTSLEVSAPLINDYPLYRLKVELRLSYQL